MTITPPPGRVDVMIVDDHEVVRRGIAEVIERSDQMRVVAEAGLGAEALRRAVLVNPHVILVDLRLPDGSGIELMTQLRDVAPQIRSIVLTAFDDDDALAAALDAGAAAFLLKSVRGAEIAEVIRAVAQGRTLLDERTLARRRAERRDPAADLSPSERRVLGLIGEGLSNREIASRLKIAEKTVKNHTTSLLAKMGLQRRSQAAAWVAAKRSRSWRAASM